MVSEWGRRFVLDLVMSTGERVGVDGHEVSLADRRILLWDTWSNLDKAKPVAEYVGAMVSSRDD